MAHRTTRSAHARLVERLNLFPQGAPPSPALYRILAMLFSEREAELVSLLPIRPFTAIRAGRVWKTDLATARATLDQLADRGILVDLEQQGELLYALPPPMAGFFEFALMRVRHDLDQKALSELFYQYLNVEEDFVRALFTDGQTQLGRALVHEPALADDQSIRVLDYERASRIIAGASHRAIGVCYCRHKMHHLDRACDAPLDICMTLNNAAAYLVGHRIARPVDAAECLDLLQQAHERRLVQFGENVREQVSFICNCCGCCCDAMIAARRFAVLHPIHTTGFLPEVDDRDCTGCGRCAQTCPVEAMVLVSANDAARPDLKRARVAEDRCLGCGLCVRACASGRIRLRSRPERVIPPRDTIHRTVVMAIERGKLQNLIFDNQVLWSHRALAAVLGAILKLPPIQRTLASQQVKSRYLEGLIRRVGNQGAVTK
jgi:ferredoxin